MCDGFFNLAFIGPGGPEFLVIMLVLLMMFGAKDAPRILRKLNEIINQIRSTADGFKREVMYGDLSADSSMEDADDPDKLYGDDDYYGYEDYEHEKEAEGITEEPEEGSENTSPKQEPEADDPDVEEIHARKD